MKETRLDQIAQEWKDLARKKKEEKERVEALKQIAREWFEAFNEHDIKKLLHLYAETAVHFSPRLKQRFPETKGEIQGKNALRDWWQGAFDTILGLHYEIISLEVKGKQVNMEYKRTADGQQDTKVTEYIKIRDGKIVESAVQTIGEF